MDNIKLGVIRIRETENVGNSNMDMLGYNMSSVYCIVIAVLFAFFVSYLFNKLLDVDSIANCYSKAKKVEDLDTCSAMKTAFDEKKFSFMVIIGILSILVGTYMASADPKYGVAGWGISSGGMLLVVYYILINWWRLDTNFKLLILGTSLAGIIYGSIRFM